MVFKQTSRSIQILALSLIVSLYGCSGLTVKRTKNITYDGTHKLDVFKSKKTDTLQPVFIFVHGGNWNSGNKNQYFLIGNRLAKKGITTVIIDYPLAPKANYEDMALAVAKAMNWCQKSIQKHGGDSNHIIAGGHSAGGHLASIATMDVRFFDSLDTSSPIKGLVLIDAGGLDMYGYLKHENLDSSHTYFDSFSKNPDTWKRASPLYHINDQTPPILTLLGEETYPSIKSSNRKFYTAFLKVQPDARRIVVPNKKHVAMITQFFNGRNTLYDDLVKFIYEPK